jgi:RNA polymerase sigma factor (sigma-70 family)
LRNPKTGITAGAVYKGEHACERNRPVSEPIADMLHALGNAGRLQAWLMLSDPQLLEQFALHQHEEAFEVLLHRHGPLVLGVCRRMLFDMQDAEDAFQATFLILARKAGSITRRSLLCNWLYGVAFRVAARARKHAFRRRVIERQDIDLTTVAGAETSVEPDLAPLLHEEVQRLPDKYRSPVVLCYLAGKTNEEAASQLQWPVGTLKVRLHKARAMLRTRLARRGVALTTGLLAASSLPAAVSAALLAGTAQAAVAFAAGNAIVAGAASPQALALSKGVLRAMLLEKLKAVAAAVLAIAIVAGAGGLAYYGLAVEPPAKGAKKVKKAKEDKDAIQGTWKVEKVEEDGKDASDTKDGKMFRSKPLTITGDKIVREGLFEMTYKLGPAARPKTIDLDNGGGKVWDGVYSLAGDTLKICAPMMPGGARPNEVASKVGSKTRLLVLKRQAKDKK